MSIYINSDYNNLNTYFSPIMAQAPGHPSNNLLSNNNDINKNGENTDIENLDRYHAVCVLLLMQHLYVIEIEVENLLFVIFILIRLLIKTNNKLTRTTNCCRDCLIDITIFIIVPRKYFLTYLIFLKTLSINQQNKITFVSSVVKIITKYSVPTQI